MNRHVHEEHATRSALSRRSFMGRAVAASVALVSGASFIPFGRTYASGATPQRGDLPGWRELFHDDFSTQVNRTAFPRKVSQKWGAYPSPWTDTSGKGRYDPDNVISVQNGILSKALRSIDGTPRVAAITPKVTDTAPYGFKYGRYEIRFRGDRFDGYKFVALLWPDVGTNITGSASGVGGNGEIDFPELDLNQGHAMGFVHFQDATRRDDQAWMRSDADPRRWHTYTLEWAPDLVIGYVDGVEIGRTTERVPNTKMHLVLQSETSLKNPTLNWHQGSVQLDWVTVWGYDAQTAVSPPPPPPPPPPPEPVGPVAWTSWPKAGSTVSGNVPMKLDGKNVGGVQAVRWYVDGQPVAYDGNGSPWTAQWDSRAWQSGTHSVFAKAKLANGSWIVTAKHDFTVQN